MASEKRLIDAYALMDCIRDSKRHNPHDDPTVAKNHMFEHDHFMKMVSLAPTVNAVEVVHGKWEDVQETDMYVPDMHFTITKTAETCSQCKVRTGFVGPKPYLLDKICPNCGARMDGGADDGI